MKIRLLIVAVFAAIMFYAAIPLSAQDEQFSCDLATLQKAIDVYSDALETLKESGETDPTIISDSLQELANEANAMRATCHELSFDGNKQTVIGPVEFSSGIYKAIAKTTDYIFVIVTPIDGECGQGSGRFSKNLFLISDKGEATEGAETLFSSEGCTALLEVSEVGEDWTLTFERLTTG